MYLKYRKNYYSQDGEDGIIEKIIDDLKLEKNRISVCEFGAWDGIHFSNTFNLVEKLSAKALYIEADKEKFKLLVKNKKKNSTIIAVEKLVVKTGKNSLDQILYENKFKKNFDILSIDIDGYDLDIWESLKNYSPKVVIIEINSSILPKIYQRHSPENLQFGNSFSSTLSVGNKKGYTLIAHTGNLIFVNNDHLKKLNFPKELLDNQNLLFNKEFLKKKNLEPLILTMLKFVIPTFLRKKLPKNIKSKILRLIYRFKYR
ncbi:FkbM family methyltransferase [Candidatus Pelagibacter sp.]|nr:FkbM family methyltransferase [Candidatus Pelagibacter sp.]